MTSAPRAVLAARYDLDALDGERSSIVAIGPAGEIVWANKAWFDFARTYGGRLEHVDVGANYFAAISGELRDFYARAAATALDSGQPFELDYDCCTPDEDRVYRMRMLPLEDSGLLILHSLEHAAPRHDPSCAPDEEHYQNRNGFVPMCSNCRRTRRNDGTGWDWVPAFVRAPPSNVTHGLCPLCHGFYWGHLR